MQDCSYDLLSLRVPYLLILNLILGRGVLLAGLEGLKVPAEVVGSALRIDVDLLLVDSLADHLLVDRVQVASELVLVIENVDDDLVQCRMVPDDRLLDCGIGFYCR